MIELPHLPNLHGLVELAKRDGVDIRPTLLRVMTDLYVQKPGHTEEEERHFTELALRLIDLVDAPTRAVVAAKIAGYPAAPVAVRYRLLRDMIQVRASAAPPSAPPPTSPTASAAVADELNELFLQGNAEERRLILLSLPYATLKPATPIAPAIAHEATLRLEGAALARSTTLFAREIERALRVSPAQAKRLTEDASGEPVVVVAIALAMPATVLQRILLCLNPLISQSVQRVYELILLHEEIEPDAALRLLAIWQACGPAQPQSAPTRARLAHQPQLAPDNEHTSASPFSRPKIRWEQHAQSRQSDSG